MVGITVLAKCPTCGVLEEVELGVTEYFRVPLNDQKYFMNRCPKCKAEYLTVGFETSSGIVYADTEQDVKTDLMGNWSMLRYCFLKASDVEAMSTEEVLALCDRRRIKIRPTAERDAVLNDTHMLTDELRKELVSAGCTCW